MQRHGINHFFGLLYAVGETFLSLEKEGEVRKAKRDIRKNCRRSGRKHIFENGICYAYCVIYQLQTYYLGEKKTPERIFDHDILRSL